MSRAARFVPAVLAACALALSGCAGAGQAPDTTQKTAAESTATDRAGADDRLPESEPTETEDAADTEDAEATPAPPPETVTSVSTVQEQQSTPTRAPETGPAMFGGQQATYRECDGAGVLIIESVVDDGTQEAKDRMVQLLDSNPGSEFYMPGMCASLRGLVDGQAIYPVVQYFGHDIDALCAQATNPASARLLTNQVDYSSPC